MEIKKMIDNLTLADRYHTLNERLKELEAEVKAVRDEIVATGHEKICGEYADVVVNLSERSTFDGKLAQSYLSAEQIAACTKKSVVTTVRAKAKTAE
jgi:uncharacterized protein YydD (DUF2326 family)